MAARLSSLFIEAPGVFGLNTQNPTGLDAKWATAATNVTFDAIGRLSARKGWINSTTTPMTGTPAIEQIAEYLRSSGSIDIISAANLKIYKGVTSFIYFKISCTNYINTSARTEIFSYLFNGRSASHGGCS